eukprot:11037602-Heterocapsa_arctica.AAC.1
MEPQVEAGPMRGSFHVFSDGLLPLSVIPGGAYDEAQVGALVRDGNIVPIRVSFVDSFLAENVQAARKKWYED